jgi:NAD/NADP transhydrogenase alpha subunit
MATTPTLILIAITHTLMVIMVLERGVGVTGVMAVGVIMVLGVRVTEVMGGIADSPFFG